MKNHTQTATRANGMVIVREDTDAEQAEAAARVVSPPSVQNQVIALEVEMTPRRLREHLDGTEESNWWTDKSAEINALAVQIRNKT